MPAAEPSVVDALLGDDDSDAKDSDDPEMVDASSAKPSALRVAAERASEDAQQRADALSAFFSDTDVSGLDVELRMAILQRQRAVESIRRDRLELQRTRDRMTDTIELTIQKALSKADEDLEAKEREAAFRGVEDQRRELYAARDTYLANLESEIYQKQLAMEKETLKALQAQSTKTQTLKTQMNTQERQAFEQLNNVADRYNSQTQDLIRTVQEAEEKVRQSQVNLAADRVRAETRRAQSATQAYDRFVKNEAKYDALNEKIQGEYANLLRLAEDLDTKAQTRQAALEERIATAKAKQQAALAKDENKRADTVAQVQGELAQARTQVLTLTAQKNELEQEVREWRNMAGSGDRKGAPNPAALTVFPRVAALFTRLTKINPEGVVGALQSVEDFMRGFDLRNADIFQPDNGQDSLQTARDTWNLDELMAPRDERVHPGAHALLQLVRRGIVALSLQRTDDRAHRIGQRKAMLVLVKTMKTALGWFNDNTLRQAANYTPWKALPGRDRVLRPALDTDPDYDPEDDEPDPGDEDDDGYGFLDFGDGNDEEDKRAERESRSDGSRASRSAKLWMVRPHAYHELFRGSQKSVMRKLFRSHKLEGTLSAEDLAGKPLSYLTSLEMQLHDAMHEAMQTMVINVWGTQSDAKDSSSAFSMMSANIINRSDDVELPRLLRDLKSIKIQRVNENSATFFPALFEDVVVLPVKGIKKADDKSTGWEKRLGKDLTAINRLELRSSATITVVLCADQDAAEVMKAAKEVRTKLTGFRLFPLVIHPQEAKYRSLLRLFVSLYRLLGYVTFYSNRQLHPDWESTGNLWSGSGRTEGLQAYLHPDIGDVYASESKGTGRVIDNLIRSYTALWEKVQNWSDQSDLATFRQANNPGLRPEQVEFQLSGNPRAVAWNNLFTEAYLQGHAVDRRKANA